MHLTYTYSIDVCKLFSCASKPKGVNSIWKDAQFASNRRPFEVLLTPFWSPIKHLFKWSFITLWYQVCYKCAEVAYFWVISPPFSWDFCNNISQVLSDNNDDKNCLYLRFYLFKNTIKRKWTFRGLFIANVVLF